MGEPFRARTADEQPIARWFQQADRNGDGALTADEMRADAARYFAILDADHDGEIDPDELRVYEQDIATEVQVNSRWKRPRQDVPSSLPAEVPKRPGHQGQRGAGGFGDNGIDGYQMYGLQGAARYGLLNIPEPVAGADADFNRSITLGEFEQAAARRFQLLDSKQAGRLALQDLEARLPTRPDRGKRARLPDDKDTRIGLPFPEGH
jgi:Ca2+-binding EF-hand superfamily protein